VTRREQRVRVRTRSLPVGDEREHMRGVHTRHAVARMRCIGAATCARAPHRTRITHLPRHFTASAPICNLLRDPVRELKHVIVRTRCGQLSSHHAGDIEEEPAQVWRLDSADDAKPARKPPPHPTLESLALHRDRHAIEGTDARETVGIACPPR